MGGQWSSPSPYFLEGRLLKPFSASTPKPVVPATFPSDLDVKDGIIDGTYTLAYQDSDDNWYSITESYDRFDDTEAGYISFRWLDTTIPTEIKICCRALVKASGVPELARDIKGYGPGTYGSGDVPEGLNNGFTLRTVS